jgi:hypothetical protein
VEWAVHGKVLYSFRGFEGYAFEQIDKFVFVHEVRCHVVYPSGDCCGEEEILDALSHLFTDVFKNLFDIILETHVKHFISFI